MELLKSLVATGALALAVLQDHKRSLRVFWCYVTILDMYALLFLIPTHYHTRAKPHDSV